MGLKLNGIRALLRATTRTHNYMVSPTTDPNKFKNKEKTLESL
jgi:hypothetical protein